MATCCCHICFLFCFFLFLLISYAPHVGPVCPPGGCTPHCSEGYVNTWTATLLQILWDFHLAIENTCVSVLHDYCITADCYAIQGVCLCCLCIFTGVIDSNCLWVSTYQTETIQMSSFKCLTVSILSEHTHTVLCPLTCCHICVLIILYLMVQF